MAPEEKRLNAAETFAACEKLWRGAEYAGAQRAEAALPLPHLL